MKTEWRSRHPARCQPGSARLGAEQMLNKYGLTGGWGSAEPAVQEGPWQTGRSDHFQCPPCTGTHPTGDHPVWEDVAAGEACLRADSCQDKARIRQGAWQEMGVSWVCFTQKSLKKEAWCGGALEPMHLVPGAQNSPDLCLPGWRYQLRSTTIYLTFNLLTSGEQPAQEEPENKGCAVPSP